MTYAESIDAYKAQLADLEASAMADLIDAYLLIQEALLADLERLEVLLRDADQPVSAATLARSEALNALIDQTQERVTQLAAALGLRISSTGQQAIDLAQEAVRQLTLDSMGTPPVDAITAGFGQLPAEAIEQIVSNLQPGSPLSRLLAELGPEAAEAVRQALIVGLGSGQNPREVARAMQDALGGSLTRAATIARTEILRAYRDAAVESMRANDDVVKGWIWHASLTDRTCAACIAMHGTKHPLSEPFGSHPNCFPEGTVVSGPKVVGSTARWYAGTLVEIVTASGNRLSSTVNHPILTPKGWVAAGLLQVGSHVVSRSLGQRPLARINPDDHQIPARIEQVAESFGSASMMTSVRMPTAAEDFHGDGAGSQVHVVRTNGLLRNRVDVPLAQPHLQQSLCWRHAVLAFLSRLGALAQPVPRIAASAPGFVGGLGVALPLLRGAGSDHEAIRFSVTATRRARLNEYTPDDGSADTVAFRQSLLRHAGDVLADEIVQVRRFPFTGHVYNLQTVDNWYSANGVIVHNCRCSPVPETLSWADLGFEGIDDTVPEIASGTGWFARQDAETQRKILGQAKYDAWKDGAFTLDDVVGFRDDPTWGPTRWERSLKDLLAA